MRGSGQGWRGGSMSREGTVAAVGSAAVAEGQGAGAELGFVEVGSDPPGAVGVGGLAGDEAG